jgi:hypothetical protein
VDAQQRAEITSQGGMGYVPVTFKGLTSRRSFAVYLDDKPFDQSIHGHDFWQTDYDPGTRQWNITFNIPLTGDRPRTLSLTKSQ